MSDSREITFRSLEQIILECPGNVVALPAFVYLRTGREHEYSAIRVKLVREP